MDDNRLALKYGRNWYADRIMFLSRKCQGCLFPCEVVVVLHSIHGDDINTSDLFPKFVCVKCAVSATRQREVIELATASLKQYHSRSSQDTEWRLSYKGNMTRMMGGLRVTVFPLTTTCANQPGKASGSWAVSIEGRFYKPFDSKEAAMEASVSLVANHSTDSVSVGVSLNAQLTADPAWEDAKIQKPEMKSPAFRPAKFADAFSGWD